MRFRPEAEIWPVMTEDELKALAEDIDRQGQLDPISLYQGDILDGRNRWLAVTRYCAPGTEPKCEEVSPLPTPPIAFAISHNEKRRHMTEGQRAMAAALAEPFYAAEAKTRQGERSDLGADLPLSPKPEERRGPRARDTAGAAFNVPGRAVQQAKSVRKKGSKQLVDAVARGELSLGKAEQITKLYPDKKTQDKQVVGIRKSRNVTRVKGLTGEIEWYTPRKYLDAAIAVMGDIDLDPASSGAAQRHVKAKRHYTLEHDGLQQRWAGRVFLNPPYAMPFVKDFIAKLVGAWQAGDIDEAVLLTNNATDTEWFHQAAHACTLLCVTRGRIRFLEASNGDLIEKPSPTHGQAFFYFGPKDHSFEKVFSQHGIVLRHDCEAHR